MVNSFECRPRGLCHWQPPAALLNLKKYPSPIRDQTLDGNVEIPCQGTEPEYKSISVIVQVLFLFLLCTRFAAVPSISSLLWLLFL